MTRRKRREEIEQQLLVKKELSILSREKRRKRLLSANSTKYEVLHASFPPLSQVHGEQPRRTTEVEGYSGFARIDYKLNL